MFGAPANSRDRCLSESCRIGELLKATRQSGDLGNRQNRQIAAMLIEDQRFIHEDLERLEQGIADRVAEEPRNVSVLSTSKYGN